MKEFENKLHKAPLQLQQALQDCGYTREIESADYLFFRKDNRVITFKNNNKMDYDMMDGEQMIPMFQCQFHYAPSVETMAMILLDCGAITYDEMKLLRMPKQESLFKTLGDAFNPSNSWNYAEQGNYPPIRA